MAGSRDARAPRPIPHDVVVRVDGPSGRVEAVIPVRADPRLVAVASGRVWTLSLADGSLSRVDPPTGRVTTIDLGEAAGLVSGGDHLWVTVGGNRIVELDGATGAVKRTIRLASRPLFELGDAGFLAAARGSLWVTIPRLGSPNARQALWRVDEKSGRVLARRGIGVNPTPPLAAGRFIWLITRPPTAPGVLTRIDIESGVAVDVPVGLFPWGMAAGAGAVWLGHISPRELWRLEPSSGHPAARIPIGERARGVAFGGGYAWVLTETRLLRIDPTTNRITRTTRLNAPRGAEGTFTLAYLDGDVWVTVE